MNKEVKSITEKSVTWAKTYVKFNNVARNSLPLFFFVTVCLCAYGKKYKPFLFYLKISAFQRKDIL